MPLASQKAFKPLFKLQGKHPHTLALLNAERFHLTHIYVFAHCSFFFFFPELKQFTVKNLESYSNTHSFVLWNRLYFSTFPSPKMLIILELGIKYRAVHRTRFKLKILTTLLTFFLGNALSIASHNLWILDHHVSKSLVNGYLKEDFWQISSDQISFCLDNADRNQNIHNITN